MGKDSLFVTHLTNNRLCGKFQATLEVGIDALDLLTPAYLWHPNQSGDGLKRLMSSTFVFPNSNCNAGR